MAATRVVGSPPAQADCAVADILAALALLAESVILELQHRSEGEGVVRAGDVDVLRSDPGVGPQDLPRIAASDGRDGSVLVVHVEARLAAAADDTADQRARMAAVASPLRTSDDERRTVVGLDAAVQQMQRLADDAAREHFSDADPLLVEGLGIVRRMLAMDRLHGGDLLGTRPEIVHVAHESRAEHLARALPAIGTAVQHVARQRRRRARAGTADTNLGDAVQRAKKEHNFTHAARD